MGCKYMRGAGNKEFTEGIVLTCLVFLYQNQLEKFAPVVKFSVKDNLNSLGVW